jgi:hypothetical protein
LVEASGEPYVAVGTWTSDAAHALLVRTEIAARPLRREENIAIFFAVMLKGKSKAAFDASWLKISEVEARLPDSGFPRYRKSRFILLIE